MFTMVRGALSGWLAALTLWPAVGVGQEFLVHPQNATVCVGEAAIFSSLVDVTGGSPRPSWIINGFIYETWRANIPLPPEVIFDIVALTEIRFANFTNSLSLEFNPNTYIDLFNGLEIKVGAIGISGLSGTSNTAYLFYEPNQKFPVTGLTATANGTAIQAEWEASSEVRTQHLVSITNVTESPDIVSSPHYTYFPSQDCQWYELMVTGHQCFNVTDPDTRQTVAASVRVAYPNISPVTAEFDNNQTVLVSWPSDGGSAYWVSVVDLDSGNQTTYTGTSPFSHTLALCGQYRLNVSVSPAQCADVPGFTHSDVISLTIACPTPETEATGQPSGTQATLPSWLAVAAMVPLLRIARPAF